jgi:acyl-coenzyme A thioesterase PaaI-like protein
MVCPPGGLIESAADASANRCKFKGLSLNRNSQTRMTNDEIRRNTEIRMTNSAIELESAFRHLGFGFLSSFDLRHSSFDSRFMAPMHAKKATGARAFSRSTPGGGPSTIGTMLKLPHTKSCFVCGLNNPLGLKMDFETDGQFVRARFAPRPEHVGFRETIHGGIISTVLDEAMVWAVGVQTKRFAYCAELNVRFLQPARPSEELIVVAELTDNRRNKLFEAKAELQGPRGAIYAASTGKYLPVKVAQQAEMLSDFAESTENLFISRPD